MACYPSGFFTASSIAAREVGRNSPVRLDFHKKGMEAA
jgi:hypothetical protein